MRAEMIARPTAPIPPDFTGGQTYELFSANADQILLAVVVDGRPVGLVNRDRFFIQMADRFGRALWEKRPIAQLMRKAPKLVRTDTTIAALGAELLADHPAEIADGLVVVDPAGLYRGVISPHELIVASLRQMESQNVELLRMTDELRRATAEAQAASRAKSDFLAMMSHEIRTPLNGVIGMGSVLAGSELSPAQREQLDVILQSGVSLNRIIGDILDVSKIEAGRLEIERSTFDAEDLVAHACALHAANAGARGVTLRRKPGASLPRRCIGDGLRIGQVLGNLISNAVKFTERGEVTISARADRDDGGQWWLMTAVADTGIGMTPEQLERAFDPFVQADISITRLHGGTGLGLSICKRLVALMGGRIAAESRPGVGSRFEFAIPILVQAAAEPAPLALAPSPARADGGLRILLVEDDAAARRVIAALLEALKAEVTVVASLPDALQALGDGACHLILMDVNGPETDGLAALVEIRRQTAARAPRTPVIAIAAAERSDVRARCLAAGMDGLVSKPIAPVQLYAAIRDALSLARNAAAKAAAAPLAEEISARPRHRARA